LDGSTPLEFQDTWNILLHTQNFVKTGKILLAHRTYLPSSPSSTWAGSVMKVHVVSMILAVLTIGACGFTPLVWSPCYRAREVNMIGISVYGVISSLAWSPCDNVGWQGGCMYMYGGDGAYFQCLYMAACAGSCTLHTLFLYHWLPLHSPHCHSGRRTPTSIVMQPRTSVQA
jgi:hypothetical protein